MIDLSMSCERCSQFVGMAPCDKCDCPECASCDNQPGKLCRGCEPAAKPETEEK
jgi:hypothetical protein